MTWYDFQMNLIRTDNIWLMAVLPWVPVEHWQVEITRIVIATSSQEMITVTETEHRSIHIYTDIFVH